jgi:hypothetical protein
LKKEAKEALLYASSSSKNSKTKLAQSALAHAVDCLTIIDPLDEDTK